jgi:hypothetical protein
MNFGTHFQIFRGVDEALKNIFRVVLGSFATLEISYLHMPLVNTVTAVLLNDALSSNIHSFVDTLNTLIINTSFDAKSLSLKQVWTIVMAFSHCPKD